MKTQILTILLLVVLISCNCRQTNKIERKGEPTIYSVQDNDKEMNQAIGKANQTLDNFRIALQSNNLNFKYFALKIKLKNTKGVEHIWVSKVTLKDNKFFGVIDNLPESTLEIKIGDTIKIDNDKISDWMYIEKGKLRGGYTIRLFRKRMTEIEQKQFDKENNIIIED